MSGNKLTFKKLSISEKKEYAELVNRWNMPDDKAKADEYLTKAAHPKGIIFPVGMYWNLIKSAFYRIKETGYHIGNLIGKERLKPGNVVYDYSEFFKRVKSKYGCDSIDWKSFPNPPCTSDWL